MKEVPARLKEAGGEGLAEVQELLDSVALTAINDLYDVMVMVGNSVVEVAKAVQQNIIDSVESMTGVKVVKVNVNVNGSAKE